MRLQAGCNLLFEATGPSSLILMLRPRSGPGQRIVSEGNECEPDTVGSDFIDSHGNLCQRLMVKPGYFQIESTVTVETSDNIDTAPGAPFVPVHELPDSVLPFLLPSRYCQSDLLGRANSMVMTRLRRLVAGSMPISSIAMVPAASRHQLWIQSKQEPVSAVILSIWALRYAAA